VAGVGGDDGRPGEVVLLGHSVEQLARGREVARRARERGDEGVVGAAVGVRDGREQGDGIGD
jgi:hypothetical protein